MSHNELGYEERIREQGYRLTPQRQIIMDALCGIGDHATIGEIYDRVQSVAPSIDRATIYRTMNLFQELRLVVAAEIENSTVYEVAHPEPHHHLVCRVCGAVATLDHQQVSEFAAHILAVHDFLPEIDHLTISGVCTVCRQEQSGS